MAHPIILIFFCITFINVFSQTNPDTDRQAVLNHNKIGKEYVFDRSKKNEFNRTELTYLGQIRAKNGRVFKILISSWYWGIAPRATSRIVVYNDRNQYIGNYYVAAPDDLPSKIENNSLVFYNKNKKDCDSSLVQRISFYNGLPKEFFLECKNKTGDIYSFGNE